MIRDPIDLRDLIYRPSLGVLPDRFLCAAADPAGPFQKLLTVRNQGERPSCIGEALAAVIDIQRIESFKPRGDLVGAQSAVHPASAAMLHAMALEIENLDRGGKAEDIRSLRSGLKGFYNTGVCTEATWLATAKKPVTADFDNASVAAMREARNVTLGAYYRVRSFINDYHAALVEAGALYVAAELHAGWTEPPDGIIDPQATGPAPTVGHAFVIVGYDRHGFLVLNSWGSDWGGYAFAGGPPLKGIALWSYEDWASTVYDAWVLRLAAPTPEAFRHAIGVQGLADFGAAAVSLAAPSVRRLEVLGRYLHLDDGAYVNTGPYPTSRQSLQTTLAHLTDTGPSGGAAGFDAVRLTLHGDISSVEEILERTSRAIPKDKRMHVHGISIVWVNDLLHGAATALRPLFDTAAGISLGSREDTDRRIEQMARPVGRALWRDVKRAALRAAGQRGDAADALARIVRLCADTGKPLHIVAEGAGTLLVAALLATWKRSSRGNMLAQVLASLTLVAPLNTAAEFNRVIAPFLEAWGTATGRSALLLKPDAAFDERLRVGAYSRSWTDLISRAFEEEQGLLIGAHDFSGELRGVIRIEELPPPHGRNGDLTASDVLQHAAVTEHVRREIERAGATSAPGDRTRGNMP